MASAPVLFFRVPAIHAFQKWQFRAQFRVPANRALQKWCHKPGLCRVRDGLLEASPFS